MSPIPSRHSPVRARLHLIPSVSVNSVVINILEIGFKKERNWETVLAFKLGPAHFRTRFESVMKPTIKC